ncbi:hypothetical protein QTH97_35420 [Variovorax sp. J22R24]|uniref:hypothetical protein n=1 Tax=Variovorax gracilis TaxID=3053502 RepID=UPI00257855FD|nr:hypothetical protein [Variovorax sp. J22R24]MDM0110227.1 hypothetical protein [Variovorax sp. J22R24]
MRTATLAAIAAAIALATFGATAQTEVPATFELKGYALGAEMTSCPQGFSKHQQGAITECRSTSETLAGKPAKFFVVDLYKGKIVAVGAGGMSSPMDVANALMMKFGPPTESKAHIQEYTWHKGRTAMVIKAYSPATGMVILKDIANYEAARAEDASAAQSDL